MQVNDPSKSVTPWFLRSLGLRRSKSVSVVSGHWAMLIVLGEDEGEVVLLQSLEVEA